MSLRVLTFIKKKKKDYWYINAKNYLLRKQLV